MSERLVRFTFNTDLDDAAAINQAVAYHQRRDHAVFGEHLLPEGDSDTLGATLGEICRAWLDGGAGGH